MGTLLFMNIQMKLVIAVSWENTKASKDKKKKSHDIAHEGSKKSNLTKITSRMVLTGGGTVDWGRMGKY